MEKVPTYLAPKLLITFQPKFLFLVFLSQLELKDMGSGTVLLMTVSPASRILPGPQEIRHQYFQNELKSFIHPLWARHCVECFENPCLI